MGPSLVHLSLLSCSGSQLKGTSALRKDEVVTRATLEWGYLNSLGGAGLLSSGLLLSPLAVGTEKPLL